MPPALLFFKTVDWIETCVSAATEVLPMDFCLRRDFPASSLLPQPKMPLKSFSLSPRNKMVVVGGTLCCFGGGGKQDSPTVQLEILELGEMLADI